MKVSRFLRAPQGRLQAGSLLLVVAIGLAAAVFAGSGLASTRRSAAPPAWAKVFAKYVGVKTLGPANAKLAPVTVGWVNAQGGIVQSPESTTSIQAAVAVINKYFRGVGGHPLKLKTCFVVQAESQGQKCAQAMDNDPSVKFVIEGVLPFGSTGFHQTNKGKKPVMGFNPITTSSATAKNTYEVTAGLFGTDPGEVSYLVGMLHAKTVSLLYPQDDPAGVTAAKLFQQIAACRKPEGHCRGLLVDSDRSPGADDGSERSVDRREHRLLRQPVRVYGRLEGNGSASCEACRRAGALPRPARPAGARRLPEVDVREHRRQRQPAEGGPVCGRVARGDRPDRQEEPRCLRAVPASLPGVRP